jgi:hypothetical protein
MPSEEEPAAKAASEEGESIQEEEALTKEEERLSTLNLENEKKRNFIDLWKETPNTVHHASSPMLSAHPSIVSGTMCSTRSKSPAQK